MAHVSSIFVTFENMGKKDSLESFSQLCLKPLHSAFGFFIYKLSLAEENGKVNYEIAHKVNKFTISLFWILISFTVASPIILTGIFCHYFSHTFNNKYKQLTNGVFNDQKESKQNLSHCTLNAHTDLENLNRFSQLDESAKYEFLRKISSEECARLVKYQLNQEKRLTVRLKIIEQFATMLFLLSPKGYDHMIAVLSVADIPPPTIIKYALSINYKKEKIFIATCAALLTLKDQNSSESEKVTKLSLICRALQYESYFIERRLRYIKDFGKSLAIQCEKGQIGTIMKLYDINSSDRSLVKVLLKGFLFTIFLKGEQWPDKLAEVCKHLWTICEKTKSIDLLLSYQGISSKKTLNHILDTLSEKMDKDILEKILNYLIKGITPIRHSKHHHKRSLSENDKIVILEERDILRREIGQYLKDSNTRDPTSIIFEYYSFFNEKTFLKLS